MYPKSILSIFVLFSRFFLTVLSLRGFFVAYLLMIGFKGLAVKILWRLTVYEKKTFFLFMFPGVSKEIYTSFENYRYYPFMTGFDRKAFRNINAPWKTIEATKVFMDEALRVFSAGMSIKWYIDRSDKYIFYYTDRSWVIGIVGSNSDYTFKVIKEILDGKSKQSISRMIPFALIYSNNDDLIKYFIDKAGIYEGLRQIFFENFDLADINRFIWSLKFIRENKLHRFSSLVRAVDVWFGLAFLSNKESTIINILDKSILYFTDNDSRLSAIYEGKNNLDLHIALWCTGFIDYSDGTNIAYDLIKKENPFERRFIGLYYLSFVFKKDSDIFFKLLNDDDIKIAIIAFKIIYSNITVSYGRFPFSELKFTLLENFFDRLDKKKYRFTVIWKWNVIDLNKKSSYRILIKFLGHVPFDRILKYFDKYDAYGRRVVAEHHRKADIYFFIRLVGDKSSSVREVAMDVLSNLRISKKHAFLIAENARNYKDTFSFLKKVGDKLKSSDRQEYLKLLDYKAGKAKDKISVSKRSFTKGFMHYYKDKLSFYNGTEGGAPKISTFKYKTGLATDIVGSLKEFVKQYEDEQITVKHHYMVKQVLLGDARELPDIFSLKKEKVQEIIDEYPMKERWLEWFKKSNYTVQDIFLTYYRHKISWNEKDSIKYIIKSILSYIIYENINERFTGWLIDGIEMDYKKSKLLFRLSGSDKTRIWKDSRFFLNWEKLALNVIERKFCIGDTDAQRLWNLLCWKDRVGASRDYTKRSIPDPNILCLMYEKKVAKKDDFYVNLLDLRGSIGEYGYRFSNNKLGNWIYWQFYDKKIVDNLIRKYPELEEVFNNSWDFIVDDVIHEGEEETPYRNAAHDICYIRGSHYFFKLLSNIHISDLERNKSWYSEQSKYSAISNLLQVSFPYNENIDDFKNRISDYDINLLYAVCLYAPQWADTMENALGIDGFSEAVWWIAAHTKDDKWGIPDSIKKYWEGEVKKRSNLSLEELKDGVADAIWFHKVYQKDVWNKLYKYAKFSSSHAGHARAKLYIDAMLGKFNVGNIEQEITHKRNKDKVRAYALIPLNGDIKRRYKFLKNFYIESKQFGSQRKASEKLAYEKALVNLAGNAGYADSTRMLWSLEDGSYEGLVLSHDSSFAKIVLNDKYSFSYEIKKNDKSLKTFPKELRDLSGYKDFLTKRKELSKQASLIKYSLEDAMIKGIVFTGEELNNYKEHKILSIFLSNLLFVDESHNIVFYDEIKLDKKYRIAHPVDMFDSWDIWQKEVFTRGMKQPFKQVFRELYILSSDETGTVSMRYSGHQVKQNIATSLLRSRGWTVTYEGEVFKRFDDVIVNVVFKKMYFTPGEIESPVIDGIFFMGRDRKILDLSVIDKILFSEVMRDLDLVVSVAHEGGVEPEVHTSTIEMRKALVRESINLLGLNNVSLKDNFCLIDGGLGKYSIHLGSGIVRKRPGSVVFVVPIHSQQRGKIFLPFVDDDPKTADVMTKIFVLANDKDIKDPDILRELKS